MRAKEDRLSELPEPILYHIFSFLPTKEVVISTSLLSKKWRYFWATVPYLYFDINELPRYCPDCNHRTTSLVDHVLHGRRRRTTSSLHRLRFRYRYFRNDGFLNSWMANAVHQQNLQEIDICFENRLHKLECDPTAYSYFLPNTMLSVPNLRTLEQDRFVLPMQAAE
ncbi:hypothetical protein Sjap_025520 [Stephania japonica]|uniref:F-box domain-containing protein n=1 Tax=Stephania japonica TaxID=461633 RepID=A0AAP0HFQ7_9MAGN